MLPCSYKSGQKNKDSETIILVTFLVFLISSNSNVSSIIFPLSNPKENTIFPIQPALVPLRAY